MEKTYLDDYYGSQRDKIKTNFFPIAMLKTPGDDSNNETEMIYFPNCIIDKIMNYHTREIFIIQRFVLNKGMSPSLVRCIVNLRHYPQINVDKVLNAKENPIIVEES